MKGLLGWLDTAGPHTGIHFAAAERSWNFVSYAELAVRVDSVAAVLQSEGVHRGDRVCILAPNGPGFVQSFFGVLRAGATVSALPPMLSLADAPGYAERLAHVLKSVQPRALLVEPIFAPFTAEALALAGVDAPIIDPVAAPVAHAQPVDLASLALIQFTSGSTGAPRGIEVPHRALQHNVQAIARWLQMDDTSVTSTWLPTSHDMGLVGTLLTPIMTSTTLFIMRPDEFVVDPLRWLETFGRHGANITSSPNFGFGFAASRVKPSHLSEVDGLDFSGWTTAITGAERVQASTLSRFVDLLRPFGFTSRAFRPAYGLAEATLAVTGRTHETPLRVVELAPNSGTIGTHVDIVRERSVDESTTEPGSLLVSCGPPLAGVEVRILDARGEPLPDRTIGEIEVSGASVARGYLAGSAPFSGVFATGDAGFIHGGELFVIGRIGDSLKVRGRAVFAEDVEDALRGTDQLQEGRYAVVLGTNRGVDRAVVFIEQTLADYEALLKVLRRATSHSVSLSCILGERGTILRTTSGKPQRRLMWEHYCRGDRGREVATWSIKPPPARSKEEVMPDWEALLWRPNTPTFNAFYRRYMPVAKSFRDGSLTEARLTEWYEHSLRSVVSHAQAGSTFYRERLDGIDASSLTLSGLHQIPFTTKEDLRVAGWSILSKPLCDADLFYETTGTSGPVTPCPRDHQESFSSNLQIMLAWREVFLQTLGHSQPIAGILLPTELHSSGDTMGEVFRNLGSCVAKMWPQSPAVGFRRCMERIIDLKCEVLTASPGTLMSLARVARALKLDLAASPVKVLLTMGEICSPALTKNLEALWGARSFDALYGAQEAFVSAVCSTHNHLVPVRPNYLFEVLDSETGETSPTGLGELVLTTLIPGAKPLIRYRTGDLVELRNNGDRTGPDAWCLTIHGRVRDSLVVGSKSLRATDIEGMVMDGLTGVYGYRLLLLTDGSVEVRIEAPDLQDKEQICTRISDRFATACEAEARVSFVRSLASSANEGGFTTWKSARIVDQRSSGRHG